MASTLKLENVAPPISGSVVSMPSIENTVAVPRWPLTVNCCVKFAAPLVSVCVPAASRSNWLKSRLLSGMRGDLLGGELLAAGSLRAGIEQHTARGGELEAVLFRGPHGEFDFAQQRRRAVAPFDSHRAASRGQVAQFEFSVGLGAGFPALIAALEGDPRTAHGLSGRVAQRAFPCRRCGLVCTQGRHEQRCCSQRNPKYLCPKHHPSGSISHPISMAARRLQSVLMRRREGDACVGEVRL